MYEEILPKEELTRLKRSFALFDVDGDGTISTKELENVMKSLGGSPPWGVLHAMIDSADSDRNGKVDFPEFVMFMTDGYKDNKEKKVNDEETQREKRLEEREEEICDLFNLFDRDGSGSISLEELAQVMIRFGGLNKEDIDLLVIQADLDGDGMVEFDEFYEMMRKPGEQPGRRKLNDIWNAMLAKKCNASEKFNGRWEATGSES